MIIERLPVETDGDKHEIIHQKYSAIKELWVTSNIASAGALGWANKNLLNLGSFEKDSIQQNLWGTAHNIIAKAFEKIIELSPERLILSYDGFSDLSLIMYIEFFKTYWQEQKRVNFSLFMFVPAKGVGMTMQECEKFTKRKFKPIVCKQNTNTPLPNWKDYLNLDSHITIPLWDLDAEKFDFFKFYDFCCKKFAYIAKRKYLFPLLESGMSEPNFRQWELFPDKDFILFSCGAVWGNDAIMAEDPLRMWKLLNENKLQHIIHSINACKMLCNTQFTWAWNDELVESNLIKIPKNKLAWDIFKTGNGNHFLFPMPLFLGYYTAIGNIECYIPEYNFHELIDALCKVLKNEPCPELFPDIPDEPGIFLDAYRNGYIKFFPRCKKYYENGDHIEAEFINSDEAEEFVYKFEENYSANPGESILIYDDGKIVCKNIDRNQLLPALEKAATDCPEYKINMRLWDGNTLREMTVEEIIQNAAERIVRYFGNDNRKALEYLQKLSKKYRDKYQRHSIVR